MLRFDYSCTGDSAGPGTEASVDEWLEDVDWAIDELLDTSGLESVDLVGLRWGASLGALAARERDEVRHLILWDPVVSGEAYFDEVLPGSPPEGTVGIEGDPFTSELRRAMAAVDLRRDLATGEPVRTSIVAASDEPAYHALREALESQGRPVTHEVIPSPGNWAEVDPFGDALIPQDIIRAIVDRVLDEGGHP